MYNQQMTGRRIRFLLESILVLGRTSTTTTEKRMIMDTRALFLATKPRQDDDVPALFSPLTLDVLKNIVQN